MPKANPAAFEFLLTRRSRPAKTLSLPVPDRDALKQLLTAAARTLTMASWSLGVLS